MSLSATKNELWDSAVKNMTDARVAHKWVNPIPKAGDTGGNNVLCGATNISGQKLVNTYPCHRPINGYRDAEILWSAFGYKLSGKIAKFYLNWLLNDSPWSKTGIIPTKLSHEFMFETGFIFEDLRNTPANLLHNFLIATRLAAEWPKFIEGWYRLVTEFHFNPAYAFFMLSVFIPPGETFRYDTCFTDVEAGQLSTGDKYDWPLDTARATEDYLLNFVYGRTVGLAKRAYSPSAITSPVNTLWGGLVAKEDSKSYRSKLEHLYAKEFSKMNSVSWNSIGKVRTVNVVSYSFASIIEIMKREELRLKIKEAI